MNCPKCGSTKLTGHAFKGMTVFTCDKCGAIYRKEDLVAGPACNGYEYPMECDVCGKCGGAG